MARLSGPVNAKHVIEEREAHENTKLWGLAFRSTAVDEAIYERRIVYQDPLGGKIQISKLV
jgi:hypothetical protein